VALAVVALALTGCETTAERSAKLERAATRQAAGRRAAPATTTFTSASKVVEVQHASLVRSSEGAAAIVTIHNTSSRALADLPIAITVRDASGRAVFENNASGLEAALASVPSLAPHATLTWVDDQVPIAGAPRTISARVGEARTGGAGQPPTLTVTGLHEIEDPANGIGAAGAVTNSSPASSRGIVVFVLAAKGGAAVAAGRAVLPEAPAHSTRPFTAFFIGDPHGARLSAGVAATANG
jgi:hypothetical protein